MTFMMPYIYVELEAGQWQVLPTSFKVAFIKSVDNDKPGPSRAPRWPLFISLSLEQKVHVPITWRRWFAVVRASGNPITFEDEFLVYCLSLHQHNIKKIRTTGT